MPRPAARRKARAAVPFTAGKIEPERSCRREGTGRPCAARRRAGRRSRERASAKSRPSATTARRMPGGSPSTSTKFPIGVSSSATAQPVERPLLALLLVAEAARRAQRDQDRFGFLRIGDPGLALLARLDAAGEAGRALVRQQRACLPRAAAAGRARTPESRPSGRRRGRWTRSGAGVRERGAEIAKLAARPLEILARDLDLDLLAPAGRRPSVPGHGSSLRAISWARFPSTRPRWLAISSFMSCPTSFADEKPFSDDDRADRLLQLRVGERLRKVGLEDRRAPPSPRQPGPAARRGS